MLICSNCGSPLEVDSLFCEKCGQRVEKLEKNSSNKSKTPIKTINTNIKPLDIKIIILKTILFLLIAFTLDTLVIGLNWVIYENSKISYVTKVSSLGTETIQQPGPIDWGLGFILIVLFPLIIGTIQALIHIYCFSESMERFYTSE